MAITEATHPQSSSDDADANANPKPPLLKNSEVELLLSLSSLFEEKGL